MNSLFCIIIYVYYTEKYGIIINLKVSVDKKEKKVNLRGEVIGSWGSLYIYISRGNGFLVIFLVGFFKLVFR